LTRHHTSGRSEWRIRLTLLLFSAFLCVVFAEVGARTFWCLRFGVPFRNPGRILYAFYPELRRVDAKLPAHGDTFYDILFLGGSVLNKNFGAVPKDLRKQLANNGQENVRIFNFARLAQTSRDSRLKYAALGDARFDLVLFYHGINEARANNAPPEIFRNDYAHYSWYEIVNTLAPYHGTASFALPYTLHLIAIKIRQVLREDRYVSRHVPREDWIHFGRNPSSAVSFEENLGVILDLAERRDDRLLLMTFALDVPENYSLEAFREKRLDYDRHISAIEIWGAREHVQQTVVVHNEIVGRLAAEHEDVLFVDQAILMPGGRRYFNDPCHLTAIGSSKFVEHLLSALPPGLQSD
jgi:hypothetical protein